MSPNSPSPPSTFSPVLSLVLVLSLYLLISSPSCFSISLSPLPLSNSCLATTTKCLSGVCLPILSLSLLYIYIFDHVRNSSMIPRAEMRVRMYPKIMKM